jgi:hypothetical protein
VSIQRDRDDPSFPQPKRRLVLHADAADADRIKRGAWGIPATNVEELREWLMGIQINPSDFKQSPVPLRPASDHAHEVTPCSVGKVGLVAYVWRA